MTDEFLTLERRAYDQLRAEILNGDLPPGTRLASSTLADRFRVSRITIANALKLLSSDGLVTLRPHREAVVSALDEDDLHEIFLIRHALEDEVLLVAAERATPSAIAYLRELDSRIRAAILRNDVVSYRQYEHEFHLQVYALSGLHLVSTTLIDLWTRLEPYRSRRHAELGLSTDSIDDRESIIAALAAHDGAGAALAMRRHVDRGYERMRETMRTRSTGPCRPAVRERQRAELAPPPGSLIEALSGLPDLRRSQGQLYPQANLLAAIVLATWCGARSRSQIARWGELCHPAIRDALGFAEQAAPSSPTIHRLLVRIGEEHLKERVEIWRVGVSDSDLPARALAGTASDPRLALAIDELRLAVGKQTGEQGS